MKYTKLREGNRKAAMDIALYLKKYKAVTQADFKNLWCNSKGWKAPAYYRKTPGSYYALSQNYDTTIAFLREHNIMTRQTINGMVFFIATQKCVKSLPKNFFIEEVEVLQSDMQKAIIFQQIAAGLLTPEVEGAAIAKVLKLKGVPAKEFVKYYPIALANYDEDYYTKEMLGDDCTKWAIISLVSFPKEYGIKSNIKRIDNVSF